MSSASPGATHRKPTRRPGRKAPTLRPDPNTSVTAAGRVVKNGRRVGKVFDHSEGSIGRVCVTKIVSDFTFLPSPPPYN